MINILELKNRALNSRLVQDSFWSLFGNVIGRGLALISGIVVARFLGKDIYGEYGIIRNTIMTIAIFSTFGLGYTATKFVAENKNKSPELIRLILNYATKITLIFSGLMALALVVSSNYVAEHILNATHLTIPLRLVAILIIFNGLTSTQTGILAGFGEFKAMAKINTIIGGVTFILTVSLTYLWNFNGALMALLITQFLNWYLNFRLVKNNYPDVRFYKNHREGLIKKLITFSSPIALQEAFYSLSSWIVSFMIIKMANYGEMGLYSAAMQWNSLILFIPGILRNVVLSHLSSKNDNEEQHNRVLKIILFFNFVMTFIPFILIILFSRIIADFYGKSFEGLSNVINIAVFTTIFSSLSGVYVNAFMSKGKNWLMLCFRIGRDLGIVIISYFLLSKPSSTTGALSVIYSSLYSNIVFFIMVSISYRAIKNKSIVLIN